MLKPFSQKNPMTHICESTPEGIKSGVSESYKRGPQEEPRKKRGTVVKGKARNFKAANIRER